MLNIAELRPDKPGAHAQILIVIDPTPVHIALPSKTIPTCVHAEIVFHVFRRD
jgi:hypothetical protein